MHVCYILILTLIEEVYNSLKIPEVLVTFIICILVWHSH